MRILHIAPQNIADVPMTLVRAERALGHESRLVTFFPDPRGYPEDECLHLPLVAGRITTGIKNRILPASRRRVTNSRATAAPEWRSSSLFESSLVRVREWLWGPTVRRAMRRLAFWDYDVYQFDAGLDFYRDGRVVRRLRELGKKIVVAYTGSDLRTRGLIRPVHDAADLRVTFEWDHLALRDDIVHVLFPFEPEKFEPQVQENDRLRVGHAPTNRLAKGTERILATLESLKADHEFEIVLIENRSHAEAVAMKARCDIFIDQLGDLGYGINALEALALGIPTCTALVPEFREHYPDHPFAEVDDETLRAVLETLLNSSDRRRELSEGGREWVRRSHDSRKIAGRIHGLLDHAATERQGAGQFR